MIQIIYRNTKRAYLENRLKGFEDSYKKKEMRNFSQILVLKEIHVAFNEFKRAYDSIKRKNSLKMRNVREQNEQLVTSFKFTATKRNLHNSNSVQRGSCPLISPKSATLEKLILKTQI